MRAAPTAPDVSRWLLAWNTEPVAQPAERRPLWKNVLTNEAQFGFSVDTETSPATLRAAQVHAGRLAAGGDPRGWDRAGEITPIQNSPSRTRKIPVRFTDASRT